MQSKRSFFNRTLFRKNLSRSWPLWGLLSLAGAMIPLYFLLEITRFPDAALEPWEFVSVLYEAATIFAPGFTACYAILCAMLVWGYLFNSRSISLFHALPVDRTCLFITNTLSGLTMIAIPYTVTAFLICLLAAVWGFFDLVAVLNTILAVVFLAVTFFGLATLCAMLTGHIFVLPAFYLLANILTPVLEGLICSMSQLFLVGISSAATRFNFLSPLVQIYTSFTTRSTLAGSYDTATAAALQGLWVVALYALAGLGMLALAWLLYKRRHSECAGDVVAFRWMRPVFRYGTALLSGLTVGMMLYFLLWESIFQKGNYADPVPMFSCMALGGLLGYYAASMLIEKSRRVFRGSLLSAAIVCVGAAALCFLVSTDIFGVERRVPELSEIESVQLEDRSISSGPFDPENYPEQVKEILAFHQALVDDRDHIRNYVPNWDEEEGKTFSHYIWLTYQLTDGTVLRRQYDLWFTKDRAEIPGTYEALLGAFYEDPVVRKSDILIPEGASISNIDVLTDLTRGYLTDSSDRIPENAEPLYAALLKDADEGNIPAKNVMASYSMSASSIWFNMEYRTPLSPWDGTFSYGYKQVHIHPQMTNTLNALVELGYMTEEQLDLWVRDYESMEDSGLYYYSETVSIFG